MLNEPKEISITVDVETERRLKTAADSRGVSVEQLCLNIIKKESQESGFIHGPELGNKPGLKKGTLDRLDALRDEIFHGRRGATDSSDLIREAREERHRDMEGNEELDTGRGVLIWGKSPFTEESAKKLLALRDEIFQGPARSSDSVDLIREARQRRGKRQEELGRS